MTAWGLTKTFDLGPREVCRRPLLIFHFVFPFGYLGRESIRLKVYRSLDTKTT